MGYNYGNIRLHYYHRFICGTRNKQGNGEHFTVPFVLFILVGDLLRRENSMESV